MRKILYNKLIIALFLIRGSILGWGVLLSLVAKTLFVEWRLGGRANALVATFFLDWKGALFMSTVCFISSNVIIYSKRYIADDKDASRFIMIVFGFILSIGLLVLSPNILSLLLGWDGLGIISYCLVIYYPTKKSRRAGILTVIRNRVGDVCILLAIGLASSTGDYIFTIWREIWGGSQLLFYLIVFAAMTKRAQLPFSAWLPAAMAAPTPVSALVHSSTLVTAGVYLLIRFRGLLDENRTKVLLILATLTMFMSGLVANFEYDLKKIIALSTLRQLGLIIFSISLGLYDLAFFHLIMHALFKAMLFLCAGAIIHVIGGSQDIRVCGSLIRRAPLLASCINYANLSLSGIPFLAGFYSKDSIVEFARIGTLNVFILCLIFVSIGLTIAYRLRLSYFLFIKTSSKAVRSNTYELDSLVIYPILFLTVVSVPSGAIFIRTLCFPLAIILPASLKIIALVIVVLGIVRANSPRWYRNYSTISFINSSIWFLPFNSSQIVAPKVLKLSKVSLTSLDQGWLEHVSMKQLVNRTAYVTNVIELIQKNQVKSHILFYLIITLILF